MLYYHVMHFVSTTPHLLFFKVEVMHDEVCKILCTVDLNKKQTNDFIDRIKEDYTVHM